MTERGSVATKDRVADIVRQLLEQQGRDRAIGGDDDLADRGLSSTDMVNLMLTVEEEFGIKIPERELRPANFRTISSIDALVRSLVAD
jgi:acyl carrier protein